ncbi:uncharacterized protein MONBRDRAFT_26888 [Monosiga brevicollis MX1]|uniref:Molybdate-anion transporter n=1 Tax=Monosiga brevicollis TaxID=81824 RepID=A9V3U0_MONBE|nr:uncharacterized protein MONBRDRAFT_26888 [Monosiga brevicollis MX1]EDQ87767.1 predicted protein [Monosiga brevicollis MX1]|eukprot:XP_001747300.1 hypothetical protein [Monosiga brevicollis MX1]
MEPFSELVVALFVLLVGVTVALQYRFNPFTAVTRNEDFSAFQRRYLTVYLLANMADWITGPYLFRLYESYGYEHDQIAALFICGYVSSLAFGPMLGGVADRYGRKRMCVVFCYIFSLSCLLKVFSNFYLLLLGRMLGGASTSLLLSTFESWMIAQHNKEGFPSEWLPRTFALATFGNGVVACLSGIAANVVADCCGHHPVRPFFLAIVCLLVAAGMIHANWEEHRPSDLVQRKGGQCAQGLRELLSNRRVWLLGIVQACFESAMYVFVFLYTPSLDQVHHRHPPLGFIFATFMLALMCGSTCFRALINREWAVSAILKSTLLVAAAALVVGGLTWNRSILLFAFIVFEFACGLFYPTISTLRGEVIPEEHRTGIMNWFRVPLNGLVVVFLLFVGNVSHQTLFVGSSILCLISYTVHLQLEKVLMEDAKAAAAGDTA